MRYLVSVGLIPILAFTFWACSSDEDDDGPGSPSSSSAASAGASGGTGATGATGGIGGTGTAGAGVGGTGGSTGGTGGTGGSLDFDPDCEAPATSPSTGACVMGPFDATHCNPVTNEGCDTEALEACDFDSPDTGFICFPPPNALPVCDVCPGEGNTFCAGGLTCPVDVGKCTKFCCDDGDCGPAGTCLPVDVYTEPVGLCVTR